MNRRLTISCLILLLALALAGCGGDSDTSALPVAEPQTVKVSCETASLSVIRDMLTLPGRTEADKDLTLSAERSGRVEWVGPAEGDRVTKGQRIASIDLTALKAALDKAKASYELASRQVERRRALAAQDLLSGEEFDEAETELQLAQSSLRQAQVDYRQGQVFSPMDGVVDSMDVDPGEYVQEGASVAGLVNADMVRIKAEVPEMDVRWITPGQDVSVRVDAYPERTWTGAVDVVAAKADETTKTFEVQVLVDNADGAVRPGMMARVTFLLREIPEALTVPLLAVREEGGDRLVYVAADGRASARTVTLGAIDGDRIQVLDGLSVGEKVIVAGHDSVEDGMEVVVR